MMKIDEIMDAIEQFAPIGEFADEDSSGIQIKTGTGEISKVLVCLEINDQVMDEALACEAEMIITHHPLIFYPISNVCSDNVPGRYIIKAIENGISVYSSHLPFDFAMKGNNYYLAELLGLKEETPGFSGRFGQPVNLYDACQIVTKALDLPEGYVKAVDGGKNELSKVGFCTGAGGSMLEDALKEDCDLFITGDLKLHEAQYAKAMGLSVIDAGHYGTEKIFTENFAAQLREITGDRLEVIEAKSNTNPYIL